MEKLIGTDSPFRNHSWAREFGLFTDSMGKRRIYCIQKRTTESLPRVLVAAHTEFGIYNYLLKTFEEKVTFLRSLKSVYLKIMLI